MASKGKTEPCLDILSVDARIREEFDIERDKLPRYREHVDDLKRSLQQPDLTGRTLGNLRGSIDETERKIHEIELDERYNFYVADTAVLISKYRQILITPIKVNFMGKPIKDTTSKIKDEIVAEYLSIARKYTNQLEDVVVSSKEHVIECTNCDSKKPLDIVDSNIYICTDCGNQQMVMLHTSSYKDIDRINISTKYTYERNVHFRDCINQYQGKQNSTIAQKVYDDLEEEFRKHHLLVDEPDETGVTPKYVKFRNILKEHIALFLKEIPYTKHYENINLIHYNFTGQQPDDISHLESKLMDDFDDLIELYDKKFKSNASFERKNFINTHYVLYQLLRRHKHPCRKEDFSVLKTLDRQLFHDEVCVNLFGQLGWNHESSF
jgi:hypothetical protein